MVAHGGFEPINYSPLKFQVSTYTFFHAIPDWQTYYVRLPEERPYNLFVRHLLLMGN